MCFSWRGISTCSLFLYTVFLILFRNFGPRYTFCNTLKLSRNSRNLNLLEPKWPVQASTGLPSNFFIFTWTPEQFGQDKNISFQPEFEPHIVQPVVYLLCCLSYPHFLELTEDLQMHEVIFLSFQLLNAPTCHELVPVRA